MSDVKVLEARIVALEAYICDVVRVGTFTNYGGGKRPDFQMRTPLANQGAVLLGLPKLPTNAGLNTELDLIS